MNQIHALGKEAAGSTLLSCFSAPEAHSMFVLVSFPMQRYGKKALTVGCCLSLGLHIDEKVNFCVTHYLVFCYSSISRLISHCT